MKSKIRVLLIGAVPPPLGGVAVHIERFFSRNKSSNEFKIEVLDLRKRLLISRENKSKSFPKIIKAFFKAQIVHIHISRNLKLLAAVFSKLLGKKIFYTHHNSEIRNKFVFGMMMKLCDRIVLVNDDKIITPEKFRSKIKVIPAFIEPMAISELPAGLNESIENYRHVIVSNCFHGGGKLNLVSGKDAYGFDTILKAFSGLCNKGKLTDALLILADPTGNMKKNYDGVIHKITLPASCTILYYDMPLDFAALLLKSSLFIRATRTDGDSLTVREALHFGIPVLASNCTRRPEGVGIFNTENINELEEKISEMLLKKSKVQVKNPDFNQLLLENYKSIIRH